MSSWPPSTSNLTWLAVIGVLNSAVAAFYYLRIIWYMYFEELARELEAVARPVWHARGAAIAYVIFFFISCRP